jgi:hypothetical protein
MSCPLDENALFFSNEQTKKTIRLPILLLLDKKSPPPPYVDEIVSSQPTH